MIIGLSGKAGSGKDLCADYLVSNYHFTKLSFASELKDMLAMLFGWNRTTLDGLTPEDRAWREQIDTYWATTLNIPHFTPRYAMQYIGTDLFRDRFSPNFWAAIIDHRISKTSGDIVVSDVRFENEYELIKKHNGIVFCINRNACKQDLHASEQVPKQYDYRISNNGSLEEYYSHIDRYILVSRLTSDS